MRFAVFGTGGVGGYFGGRLAQAGNDVVFIARGDHLRAIQTVGLRVDSIMGDFVIHPTHATDNPAWVGQVDVVLVAVKAWQVSEAAQVILPMVSKDTLVVPLQNGVDAPSQLVAVLGVGHVVGGLCQISAFVAAPGHIRHVGIDPLIAFGELDSKASDRLELLRQTFLAAGVRAETPADIHIALWEKFLFIAAISGVCAVTRAPVGTVRSVPESRYMLEQAMHEIVATAHARGVHLPEDAVARRMAFVDGLAPAVVPSMVRDILEGRPSELGSQSGAVVRIGLESGVPTPVHAFLYHSLLPQELRARGDLQF